MSEYTVSDYGIFSDANATTEALNEKYTSSRQTIAEVKTTLSDQSIFMGPAAENCISAIGTVDTKANEITSDLATIKSYITESATNYKSGDQSALNLQLDVGGSTTTASAYNNPANISGSNLEFVNSLVQGAVEAYNKYGVLPSLTLAQAILESGWGKHKIGNNIFGIKARSSWTGKTKTVKTKEWSNGKYITINDTFRDYDSVAESVEDHAKLLTNKRYQKVLTSKNYKEACKAVKDAGYATSPTYTKSLTNLIEQYGLDQWDPKTT